MGLRLQACRDARSCADRFACTRLAFSGSNLSATRSAAPLVFVEDIRLSSGEGIAAPEPAAPLDGMTALEVAASAVGTEVCRLDPAIEDMRQSADVEAATAWLDAGGDVDATVDVQMSVDGSMLTGTTMLMEASVYSRPKSELLLQRRANLNLQNSNRNSADA